MSLLLACFVSIGSVSLISCGSDDDDDNNNNDPTTSDFDSHAVDLGLPSGTLWADQNLGANTPEDYGNYYAWGEVESKSNYSWENYKYGEEHSLTKYVPQSLASQIGLNGFYDDKSVLEKTDDAAATVLGGKWRTPSYEEWKELSEQCTWTWATVNDINGSYVTGPNGNSIFLPAAGGYNGPTLRFPGFGGAYWTTSYEEENPSSASYFYFRSGSIYFDKSARYFGRSIRPVRNK